MPNRKNFLKQGSLGFLAFLIAPLKNLHISNPVSFEGLVVNDLEGEAVLMRDGTSTVRIKVAKSQGSESISFLSESFRPGDALPVHKHLNEDELIFIHRGKGLFTLGEKEYPVSEGSAILIPKGIWHGLLNNGSENIEMRMSFSPSGFENYFREVGSPVGKPFIKKTMDQRRAIAKKWGMIYKN